MPSECTYCGEKENVSVKKTPVRLYFETDRYFESDEKFNVIKKPLSDYEMKNVGSGLNFARQNQLGWLFALSLFPISTANVEISSGTIYLHTYIKEAQCPGCKERQDAIRRAEPISYVTVAIMAFMALWAFVIAGNALVSYLPSKYHWVMFFFYVFAVGVTGVVALAMSIKLTSVLQERLNRYYSKEYKKRHGKAPPDSYFFTETPLNLDRMYESGWRCREIVNGG